MSEHQPPAGTPEYLDQGAGTPLPPEPTPPTEPTRSGRGRGRRRAWWIGGGVLALAGLGAGAWAALSFFHQGAQPAEALPSTTVGYVSIDLDPAGGQKIDAFRTLNKFPAFKDEVGVNSVDELRSKLGKELVQQSGCPDLSYDQDIAPWLGDRMAAAAVVLGDDRPHLVVVAQVTNEDKARSGIASLNKCSGSGHEGVSVHDGWAVLAQSQKVADEVVAATAKGSLADDATYQKWTKELGEAGVVNAYASPDAGKYLVRELGGFFGSGLPESFSSGTSGDATIEPGATPSISSSALHSAASDGSDPLTGELSGFKGGAATLRFTGDGLELAMAGDSSAPQLSELTGNTGGTLVSRLPSDTAAAAGMTFSPGWLTRQLDRYQGQVAPGTTNDELMRELSRESGLNLPADAETLLGSGISISLGKNFDLEAAENSSDGSGLPVGAVVKGDPAAIERVLDKIRAKIGGPAFLRSDSSGDLEAIGPSDSYDKQLLQGGDLGDDDTFRSVISHAGDASSVLYLSIDALEPSITKAAANDRETLDNLTPLRAVGVSAWKDGDVARFSFKITTN